MKIEYFVISEKWAPDREPVVQLNLQVESAAVAIEQARRAASVFRHVWAVERAWIESGLPNKPLPFDTHLAEFTDGAGRLCLGKDR